MEFYENSNKLELEEYYNKNNLVNSKNILFEFEESNYKESNYLFPFYKKKLNYLKKREKNRRFILKIIFITSFFFVLIYFITSFNIQNTNINQNDILLNPQYDFRYVNNQNIDKKIPSNPNIAQQMQSNPNI